MQVLSLLWGIFAILGMLIGFIPFLGALNWLIIPFAGVGLIFSVIALAAGNKDNIGGAIAGMVACCIAILFGTIRLIIGFGVF